MAGYQWEKPDQFCRCPVPHNLISA